MSLKQKFVSGLALAFAVGTFGTFATAQDKTTAPDDSMRNQEKQVPTFQSVCGTPRLRPVLVNPLLSISTAMKTPENCLVTSQLSVTAPDWCNLAMASATAVTGGKPSVANARAIKHVCGVMIEFQTLLREPCALLTCLGYFAAKSP